MDSLMIEVATNPANYAVGRFGQHLPKSKQLRLWQRYYDCSLSSQMAFFEIHNACKVRARAIASEN